MNALYFSILYNYPSIEFKTDDNLTTLTLFLIVAILIIYFVLLETPTFESIIFPPFTISLYISCGA